MTARGFDWALGAVATEAGIALVLDIKTESGLSLSLVLDLDREAAKAHARGVLAALGDGRERTFGRKPPAPEAPHA